MGRRTEGDPCVRSGRVLSETAGARGFGRTLNSESPDEGRGQHRRGRPGFKPVGAFPPRKCGSNLLSGAGFAQLRGQAQVVAALESI